MSEADPLDPFPDWSKPATKGDVVQAMIWSRGVSAKIGAVVIALYRGDREAAEQAIREYFHADHQLTGTIDQIGGTK